MSVSDYGVILGLFIGAWAAGFGAGMFMTAVAKLIESVISG